MLAAAVDQALPDVLESELAEPLDAARSAVPSRGMGALPRARPTMAVPPR
jgi:hypothetical protein